MLDVPHEMLPGAISSRGPFAEVASGVLGKRAGADRGGDRRSAIRAPSDSVR